MKQEELIRDGLDNMIRDATRSDDKRLDNTRDEDTR